MLCCWRRFSCQFLNTDIICSPLAWMSWGLAAATKLPQTVLRAVKSSWSATPHRPARSYKWQISCLHSQVLCKNIFEMRLQTQHNGSAFSSWIMLLSFQVNCAAGRSTFILTASRKELMGAQALQTACLAKFLPPATRRTDEQTKEYTFYGANSQFKSQKVQFDGSQKSVQQ